VICKSRELENVFTYGIGLIFLLITREFWGLVYRSD
jgi:hypothetical protein